jgi:lysozyme
MTPSKNCIDLIKKFEGFRSEAYQDSVGIWTVGYGSTMWPDGKKVQPGQRMTIQEAEAVMTWELTRKGKEILSGLPTTIINQNQYDALVSFAYNLGVGALLKSTLFKKLKVNPNDPSIRTEFMRWVNAGGKRLTGLVRRREAEANLYFKQ